MKKYLIDNNLPPGLAVAIRALGERGPEVHAVRELFPGIKEPGDTPDLVWLKQCIDEGDWVIITEDLYPKSPHEAEAWRHRNLTVFRLESGWGDLDVWEKSHRLLKWWPKLVETAENKRPQTWRVPVKSMKLRR